MLLCSHTQFCWYCNIQDSSHPWEHIYLFTSYHSRVSQASLQNRSGFPGGSILRRWVPWNFEWACMLLLVRLVNTKLTNASHFLKIQCGRRWYRRIEDNEHHGLPSFLIFCLVNLLSFHEISLFHYDMLILIILYFFFCYTISFGTWVTCSTIFSLGSHPGLG